MNNNVLELFGIDTEQTNANWETIVIDQYCPYLEKTCVKVRKSQPEISIGTCSIKYGAKDNKGAIICPHRFLQKRQIFMDCIHLLTLHEPGNELHLVSEVSIPGGSVDYVLVSARDGKIKDFVGIELQALDTTGTLWPQRQIFLKSVGLNIGGTTEKPKPYGVNWKMTAKTILVQLHHKVETFEHLNKHFVLVLQDVLLDYMRSEFSFNHIQTAKIGDSMHFHPYIFRKTTNSYQLGLAQRVSTDANGVATALGLQVSSVVELEVIIATLQSRLSNRTLLTI